MKKLLFIGLILILLMSGCSKKEKTENSNHFIYYTIIDFNSMKTNLNKINTKTLEKEILIETDKSVFMIRYDNNKIYAICDNKVAYIDNNKINYISSADEYVTRYSVSDDNIYYTKDNSISDENFEKFAMKNISNNNIKIIHEMGISQLIVDDYIYYKPNSGSEVKKLLKYNLDGTNKKILYENLIGQMIKYDDYLYFVNYDDNKSLYKMKSDGSNIKKLLEGPFEFNNYTYNQIDGYTNMGVIDNYLYFINSKDNFKLYKTNEMDTTKVIDESLSSINIIDNNIYITYKDYNKKGIYLFDENTKTTKQIINELITEYIVK